MGNQDSLLDILIGVDAEASADLISSDLSQALQDFIKPFLVSVELDAESINNVKRSIESMSKDFTERLTISTKTDLDKSHIDKIKGSNFDLSDELVSPKNLTELAKQLQDLGVHFNGLRPAITAVTQDMEGFDTITMRLNETDGLLRKVTLRLGEMEDGTEGIQVLGTTLDNNFNRLFEGSIKKLRLAQTELAALKKLESAGKGSDDGRRKIADLEMQAEKERIVTLNSISQALEKNLILETEAKVMRKRVSDMTSEAQSKELANDLAKVRQEEIATLKEYESTLKRIHKLGTKPEPYLSKQEIEAEIDELQRKLGLLQEEGFLFDDHKAKLIELQGVGVQTDEIIKRTKEYQEAETALNELIAKTKELQEVESNYHRNQHKVSPEIAQGQENRMTKLKLEIEGLERTLERLPGRAMIGIDKKLDSFTQASERANRRVMELEKSSRSLDQILGKIVQRKDFSGQMQDFFIPKEAVEKGAGALEEYIRALHGADSSVSSLRVSTRQLTGITHEFTVKQNQGANFLKMTRYAYDENAQSIRMLSQETRVNTQRLMAWSEQINVAIKRMFAWGVAAQVLYGSLRKIKEGIGFLIELDKNLTQVAIVQNTSRGAVQGLAYDYAKLASEMRKTLKEVSEVNMELIRQGISLEEATNRMQAILKLSSAALISTDRSLEIVTAGVNAMHVAADRVADVMLRASMISASNVQGLGEAFTKTASSAYAAGVSIEETTAILATMKEVTQESDSNLGTSLKTIVARFNRVNEDTGELNENLNDVERAFRDVGIAFKDSEGEIRPFFQLMEELSWIWNDLTKVQQAYVATQAAGTRMQNRFFAIISNFNKVMEIKSELMEADGTLTQSYATYLDSVEAAQNRLTAAVERFWTEMLESDAIKGFYNLLAAIVEKANELGGISTMMGAGLLGGVGSTQVMRDIIRGWESQKNLQAELTSVYSYQDQLLEARSGLLSRQSDLTGVNLENNQKILQSIEAQLDATRRQGGEIQTIAHQNHGLVLVQKDGTRELKAQAGNLNLIGKSIANMGRGILLNVGYMAMFTVATVALSYVFKQINDYIHRQEVHLRDLKDAGDTFQKDTELYSLVARLEEEEKLAEQGVDNREKILNLQKQIAAVEPGWTDAYDPDTLEPMVTDSARIRENMERAMAASQRDYDESAGDVEKDRAETLEKIESYQTRINQLNAEYAKLQEKNANASELVKETNRKLHEYAVQQVNQNLQKEQAELAEMDAALAKREAQESARAQTARKAKIDAALEAFNLAEKEVNYLKSQKMEIEGANERLEERKQILEDLVGGHEILTYLLANQEGGVAEIVKLERQGLDDLIAKLENLNVVTKVQKDQLKLQIEMNKNSLHELEIIQERYKILSKIPGMKLLGYTGELAAGSAISALEGKIKTAEEIYNRLQVYTTTLPDGVSDKDKGKVQEYATQLQELHNLLRKIELKEYDLERIRRAKDFASEEELEYLLIQENALIEDQINLNKQLEASYYDLFQAALSNARTLASTHPSLIQVDEVLGAVVVNQEELAKQSNEVRKSIEDAALAVDKYRNSWEQTTSTIAGLQLNQWQIAKDLINPHIQRKIDELGKEIEALQKSESTQIDRINEQLKQQEDYYQAQIDARQKQIELIDRQIEQETRLVALKQKTDELIKLQTDRRYTYITEMGQQVFTFDRMQYDKIWREREELIRQYKNDDLKDALRREIKDLEDARKQKQEIAKKEIDNLKNANKQRIDLLRSAQTALRDLMGKGLADIQQGFEEFMDEFEGVVGGIEGLAARIAEAIKLMNQQPQGSRGGVTSDSRGGTSGNRVGTGSSSYSDGIEDWNASYVESVRDNMVNKGMSYDEATKDALEKYHAGGVVGGKNFNPKTEQVAKLLLGEVVLSEEHLNNIPNLLKGFAGSVLEAQLTSKDLLKNFPQVTSSNVSSPSTYHLNNVTISTPNPMDFFKQIDHLVMARR